MALLDDFGAPRIGVGAPTTPEPAPLTDPATGRPKRWTWDSVLRMWVPPSFADHSQDPGGFSLGQALSDAGAWASNAGAGAAAAAAQLATGNVGAAVNTFVASQAQALGEWSQTETFEALTPYTLNNLVGDPLGISGKEKQLAQDLATQGGWQPGGASPEVFTPPALLPDADAAPPAPGLADRLRAFWAWLWRPGVPHWPEPAAGPIAVKASDQVLPKGSARKAV